MALIAEGANIEKRINTLTMLTNWKKLEFKGKKHGNKLM